MITLFKNRDFFDMLDSVFEAYPVSNGLSPRSKINQKENEYELLVSVPGLTKSDIKITTDNRELQISYEKEEKSENSYFMGGFTKKYAIPDDVNESEISAKVENGILQVTLPMSKKKIKERTIEIL